MRVQLSCQSCKGRLGEYDLQNPQHLEAILVLVHGGGAHQGCHQLQVSFSSLEAPLVREVEYAELDPPNLGFPAGDVRYELECQHHGCPHYQKRERYQVPEWAVGAVTLLCHAKQEGHVLRAWLNGKELVPQ